MHFFESQEGFKKVDFDYVVNSAKVAQQNGCKQFHLVSSSGANKNSYFLYPKIKGLQIIFQNLNIYFNLIEIAFYSGESEDAISQMNFEKVSIYRPKYGMNCYNLLFKHGQINYCDKQSFDG